MATLSLELPADNLPLTKRDRTLFVVFSTWSIIGLFLDGWSHNHHKPETFFTPWHAVLYSGFAVGMAVWLLERRRLDVAGEPATLPDRITLAGLALFGVAAVGDFGWHQAFGIEANLAALLSPTHLLLMTGGVLLVSAPLRDQWKARTAEPDFVAVAVSATLVVAIVSFFLMYLSPYRVNPDWRMLGGATPLGQQFQINVIASVLVANLLFVGEVLLLLRRWRMPFGTFTVSFTAVAVALSGLDTFQLAPLAVTAVVGGLAADVLVNKGRSPLLVAALTPAALWIPYFAVMQLHYHLGWQIHLWAGAIFLAALSGLGLALLAFPPAVPTPISEAV